MDLAKATEGTSDPGAGAEGPSGVWGRGTVRWLSWELERPSSVPACGDGSMPAYNRQREVTGGREGVGGGRSTADGRDNTTRLEGRAPTSPVHEERGRNTDECRAIG